MVHRLLSRARWGAILALVALLAGSCALFLPRPPQPPSPVPPPSTPPAEPPLDWILLYEEDFDSGTLDTSRWKPYHNTYGDGNHELACLTPGNVALAGGSLVISARREQLTCPNGSSREFSSGFIGSRETGSYYPLYGRYEIRARLPHGQGLWPAFWLRHRTGSSTAEVDVMEYFHSQRPGRTSQALHLPRTVRYNVAQAHSPFETPTTTPGWHTWAVEITPAADGAIRFTYFTDGVESLSYLDTNPTWATSAPPDASWDIAVNLAVGGNWVGHPDDPLGLLSDIERCAQQGTYPACSSEGIERAVFPALYEVDWVRVYRAA